VTDGDALGIALANKLHQEGTMVCYGYGYFKGTVTKVTDTTMTFTADSKLDGAKDGDPYVPGTYTVKLGLSFVTKGGKTPDGIPFPASGNGGDPYKAGAKEVNIFLNHEGLQTPGEDSKKHISYIRGAVEPYLFDEAPILEKFPDCYAEIYLHGNVEVKPDQILAVGTTVDGTQEYTIDLMDPALADPNVAQSLQWGGGKLVQLVLTPAGRQAIGLPGEGPHSVTFELHQLWIYGTPVSGEGFGGWIDVRDTTLAVPDQNLAWAKAGVPVTIDSTPLGAAGVGITLKVVKDAVALLLEFAHVAEAARIMLSLHDSMQSWKALQVHTAHPSVKIALRKIVGCR